MTISASGDDINLSQSTAGSGGLIAGASAQATVLDTSTTKAYIADGTSSASATKLNVAALTVSASHTAQFDSQASSIEASAFGASGASGTSTIISDVEATIGDWTTITTGSLDVTAVSTTLKNFIPTGQGEWDVQAGAGGVADGSAADSETNITNTTFATVGNDTTISVVGNASDAGDFIVSAYNDIEAYDSVDVDAGGLIDVAGSTSEVQANTDNATATVGSGANIIDRSGDFDVEAYTQGIIDVEPKAHTYGLASASGVYGLASITEATRSASARAPT